MTYEALPAEVTLAIHSLIAEFAYRIDFDNGMSVPELFRPDGYYESDGVRSTGPEAIRAAYVKRASFGPRTARHIFTNIRLSQCGADEYAGSSIMLLFAESGTPPLPAIPLLVSDVTDRYQWVDGRPYMKSRALATVFVRPDASPVLPLGDGADEGA